MRKERQNHQVRKINFSTNWIKTAHGSCLAEFGNTRVLATAMYSPDVPAFLNSDESGWLTAEYNMLPASTPSRISRNKASKSRRTQEIQRLIGRSLRAAVNIKNFPGYTIHIDTDVLQADGGTRTTGINAAMIALALCASKMEKEFGFNNIIHSHITAISVGIVNNQYMIDLDYAEDSTAQVDMNVVMRNGANLIEVQGTAESGDFSRNQLSELLDLAENGINQILNLQKEVLNEA